MPCTLAGQAGCLTGLPLRNVDTGTLVFLIIGGLGVVVLAVGLLGGEFLHLGDVSADGPVSVEVVAGFAGAFGFAAAIANELLGAGDAGAGGPLGAGAGLTVAAAAIGVAAALPAGWLTMRLSRAARNMPTDGTPTRDHLVGTLGVVITPIHPGGYGEIRVRLGGQPVKLSARADLPIPLGAQVFVVEAVSDTSVVVEQTPTIQ
ncbi:NfeD family protein [Solwaraspora sp. WMMD937]|uniref:NfeD family protein n=1 Tax=Solwaraspora sp. WMMD937 TaxID=3016090 RepID=UPI002499E6A4|nr:NfeD family protein [Solwaraspora sp. WMMD937]WFE22836.1 NfeD family protein [Solwaraspora sp. WMMD937]